MPEICEITITAQYLLTKLKGRYITNIHIIAGKYTHMILKGKDLIQEYQPLKIINIDNKGKLMWFVLEDSKGNNVYIINNYGLTGEWSFYSDKNDRIVFDIATDPYDMKKNKDYKLYYGDARNFGLIQITDSRKVLDDRIDKLAPDVLKTNFTDQEFISWINDYLKKSSKRKNVPIVKALLQQDKKDAIISGIGNYLASEILYRAKISPYTHVGDLTQDQLIRLANTIKYTTKLCYLSNITGYMKKLANFVPKHIKLVEEGIFPNYHPEIKIPKNETFKFLVYGRKEDDLGNQVKRDIIVPPRATYWVPNIQK